MPWPAGAPSAQCHALLRSPERPTIPQAGSGFVNELHPFPQMQRRPKYPVVLQGNINAVFGLWCSSAHLPITRGSIVQTRIPC